MADSSTSPDAPPAGDDSRHLDDYRRALVAAEQKAQEDYDKHVIALSGGALGISFLFLKDVIGGRPIEWDWALLAAWYCWAASIIAVLASFFLSQLALRAAIRQLNAGKIYDSRPGGVFATATAVLNVSGGILFFVGVCLMTTFAGINIKGGVINAKQAATTASAAPATPTTAGSAALATSSSAPAGR